MNAALRLISGAGELEKGWKRLLGSRSGRSESSEAGVDATLEGVLIEGDPAFTVCPCCPTVDTHLLPISFCEASPVEVLAAAANEPLPTFVDILLPLKPIGTFREGRKLVEDAQRPLFRAVKHCRHVYDADDRIFEFSAVIPL